MRSTLIPPDDYWVLYFQHLEKQEGFMTHKEREDFLFSMDSVAKPAFECGWVARDLLMLDCVHCGFTDLQDHFIHAHGEMIASKNPGNYGTACPHCGRDQKKETK